MTNHRRRKKQSGRPARPKPQSVCPDHVPDYATDGRELKASRAPCAVCGKTSVIVLPPIT